MDDTVYNICLKVNDVTIEIDGRLATYNVTIISPKSTEIYRVSNVYGKTYRIGRLIDIGTDTANIGIDYNLDKDDYHMIWPTEDVFKEVIKIIDTLRPSLRRIDKSVIEHGGDYNE